jgi:acetyltransferase EpsM
VLDVVVVGAGGHAAVVADLLLSIHEKHGGLRPVAFVDDDPRLAGGTLVGLPIRGAVASLENIAHDAVVVAIGDNRARRHVFETLRRRGETFATVCPASAIIAREVHLGLGTVVVAGAVVNVAARIGHDVIVNTGSTVDHHAVIGDHAHVAPGAHLGGQVSVGEGALIGTGAVVLPGRCVGAWSIVGAQALVSHDVADGAVVTGIPARATARRRRQEDSADATRHHG